MWTTTFAKSFTSHHLYPASLQQQHQPAAKWGPQTNRRWAFMIVYVCGHCSHCKPTDCASEVCLWPEPSFALAIATRFAGDENLHHPLSCIFSFCVSVLNHNVDVSLYSSVSSSLPRAIPEPDHRRHRRHHFLSVNDDDYDDKDRERIELWNWCWTDSVTSGRSSLIFSEKMVH